MKVQEVQQPEVIFLKIKASNPIVRTSSFFEESKLLSSFIRRSDAVSGKGLDVIIKLRDFDRKKVDVCIREFQEILESRGEKLKDYLDVVTGHVVCDNPIFASPSQRCIGYYMIKVDEDWSNYATRLILQTPVQQVFITDDEYAIWATYVGNNPADCKNQVSFIYSDRTVSPRIKDAFWSFFLETHISKEGATSRTLAKEIREMIQMAKGKEKFFETCFDVMEIALERNFKIPELVIELKAKASRAAVYNAVKKLLDEGFLRIEKSGKTKRNATYGLDSLKFQGLGWIRSLH
ncbi:MAG: hypothetical protein H3Z52_10410 [archaeon]|nr:hypothetical protein [archaeon]